MELWLILAVLAISVMSMLVYFTLMVFYPEWVGITGKVALDAERSHVEESTSAAELKNS